MPEFERRVEAVKNAIMAEMDEKNAREMHKYGLAKRRKGICEKLLNTQDKKAAKTLGILGCA